MSNKRENIRTSVLLKAQIAKSNGPFQDAEIFSASLGGAFVSCDPSEFSVGQDIKLSILLGEGVIRIECQGKVVYKQEEGVGIGYHEIDPQSLEHLSRLMMYHVAEPELIHHEVQKSKRKRKPA